MESFANESLPICQRHLINEDNSIFTGSKDVSSTGTGLNICDFLHVHVQSLLYEIIESRVKNLYGTIICACNNSWNIPLTRKPLKLVNFETNRIKLLSLIFFGLKLSNYALIRLVPCNEDRFGSFFKNNRWIFAIVLVPLFADPFFVLFWFTEFPLCSCPINTDRVKKFIIVSPV